MHIKIQSLKQIHWVVIVVGIIVIIWASWLMNKELTPQHQPILAEMSPGRQNMKMMSEIEMQGMAEPSAIEAPQATPVISPLRQQMIGMQTMLVETRQLTTTVRAVSRVTYNEQRIAHVNLRISGWIENLHVDFAGKPVKKGQPLFTLYSPELVATQEEYLLALQAVQEITQSPLPHIHQQAQQVVEAARDRLRLWTFTDIQIEELAIRGTPTTSVTIYSPMKGYVIDKAAFQGMFVKPEMTMYTIADLSTIWVQAEVYEYELPLIKEGQTAALTLEAFPGETFSGHVTYIYPYLNKKARTVQVRLEFPNPHIRLKADMYGTTLIAINRGPSLAIPNQAVLDSGLRQMVYVAHEKGRFEPREVMLGAKVGSFFEVTNGLDEGERIVTSGTFLLDSESRLMGTNNMMGALGMGDTKMETAKMGKMRSMDKSGMNMDMKKEPKAHTP